MFLSDSNVEKDLRILLRDREGSLISCSGLFWRARVLALRGSFYLEWVDLRFDIIKALWVFGDSWYLLMLSDIFIFIAY